MDTIRVLSVILLVLVVSIGVSDATSRVLMADEKPNPEKASPSPTPNSPPVNKELNQNPQPKPVVSGSETKKEPADPQPVKNKEDGTKGSENSPNGKKDGGMQVSKGTRNGDKDGGQKESKEPPKNDNKKDVDMEKEKNGPSKSPDDPKKDDGTKGGDGSAKSEEKTKKDDGANGGEGPSTREENRKKDDGKQGGKGPNGDESHIDKSQLGICHGSLLRCEQKDLAACLQQSEIDPKEFAILIQNTGDYPLDVNITVPLSVTINAKNLKLAKHSSEKVNITVGATKTWKIVLDAGKGQCVIRSDAGSSVADWVQQFPAYARQLTPVYGAYFVFGILVIAGAVWGFCKFRRSRRRADDGVAYQQLEMGTQRQSSTEIVEESTVDGWEQGWDDEWDEEEATTRPSTTRPNGNISANGLSSRSANKNNDWDIEWDD